MFGRGSWYVRFTPDREPKSRQGWLRLLRSTGDHAGARPPSPSSNLRSEHVSERNGLGNGMAFAKNADCPSFGPKACPGFATGEASGIAPPERPNQLNF